MLPHERDFFIARIKSGYLRLKHNNNVYKFKLNQDSVYESEEVFNDVYTQGLNSNLVTDTEIVEFMRHKGIWDDEREGLFNKEIPEYIENVKVRMYELSDKKDDVDKARLYLNAAKDKLYNLFDIRHQFDYLSAFGVALYARWQFLVNNCVTNIDGSKIDWHSTQMHDILNIINSSNISEDNIRDMSRNEPWSSIWSISKKCGDLFNGCVADYTEDQKRLATWSILYDNVREQDDAPSIAVFDDNDCFDGWMIIRNRKTKKESEKEKMDKKIGGNSNAQEVFIPVKCLNSPADEDRTSAENIFSLNNQAANYIINSRIRDVEEHGKLRLDELTDVRAHLNMEKTKLGISMATGK